MASQTGGEEPAAQGVAVGALPARVGRVSVSGVSRIRAGFLAAVMAPTLGATTVQQAADAARDACGRLAALGMARQGRVELRQGAGDTIDVHVACADGGRVAVRTGVDVGGDEGTASVAARMNNVWGGGEYAEAHYARGTQTAAAFRAVLGAPVGGDPARRVELTAQQSTCDARAWGSHDDVRRSVGAAFRRSAGAVADEVAYAVAWREVAGVGARASPELRRLAGHSVKAGVTAARTYDSRDSPTVPTAGTLARASLEAAGLGGSTRLARALVEVQASRRVGASCVVAAGLQAGAVWSPGAVPLADRFFVGGAHSVRGFAFRGIGPRDGADALGGDVFYAAGLSVLSPPLPRLPALRAHLWANAGQCALLLAAPGPRADAARFLRSPSASVGVGLVYAHSLVRAELSWCLPLAATPTDQLRPGLQLGLGLQFL
ncbi:hypothetical protein GGI04_000805 [Coemansia thaxteri]|nr:hypothetical protein GGI04_000805 [Coemansia thaxteri]